MTRGRKWGGLLNNPTTDLEGLKRREGRGEPAKRLKKKERSSVMWGRKEIGFTKGVYTLERIRAEEI